MVKTMKRSLKKVWLIIIIQTIVIIAGAEVQQMLNKYISNAMFEDTIYIMISRIFFVLLMMILYITLGVSTILIFRFCPVWKKGSRSSRIGYIVLLIFVAMMTCLHMLYLIGEGALYSFLSHTELQFFTQLSPLTYMFATLFVAMILPNLIEKTENA